MQPVSTQSAGIDPLLDQGEVSKILKTTVKFLEARRCRGGGPPFVKVGRLARYRLSDLNDWIAAQSRTSTCG